MDSFISWIGGKKLLRKKIIEQFRMLIHSKSKVRFLPLRLATGPLCTHKGGQIA